MKVKLSLTEAVEVISTDVSTSICVKHTAVLLAVQSTSTSPLDQRENAVILSNAVPEF